MKKLGILGITLLSVVVLGACSATSKKSTSTDSQESTAVSSSSRNGNWKDANKLLSTGDYEVGKDIPEGSYYLTLTRYNPAEGKDYNYVNVALYKNGKKENFLDYKDLKSVSASHKLTLKKGNIIDVSTYYVDSFSLSLFSDEQYENYLDDFEKTATPSESSASSSSESTSTSSSESAPSSSSSTSASSSTIETTADDFYAKMNSSTLETGKTYKFTGKAADKNLWGESGDDDYTIYVSAYDSNKGKDDVITLDTTKSIYETLKNATEFEVTVRVTEDTEFDDYDLNIVTATPK